jgi:hypothetical protein
MRLGLPLLGALTLLAACPSGTATQSGGGQDGGSTFTADSGTDAGSAAVTDAGLDSGVLEPDAGADAGTDAGSIDPCPTLTIPATCFGRNVVFREWSPSATGDGSFFSSQAPWRLGFTRTPGTVWLVKFRVEDNTYLGKVIGYGDGPSGTAWISDQPCDPSFAITHNLITFGARGGGMVQFIVVHDDADERRLATDSAFQAYQFYAAQHLRGGHCYYAAFENTDQPPSTFTPGWFTSTADGCGSPDCYYLAFDFAHLLHDPTSGSVFGGNVISGLTH